MTVFRYKAVAPSGEIHEAEIEAPTIEAVVARLQAGGLLTIRVAPAGGRRAPLITLARLGSVQRLPQGGLALLARQLATLLHAGLPVDRALEIAAELEGQPRRRATLSQLLDRVRGGMSLADAMAAVAPAFRPFFINLVRAGEAGGSVEPTLSRLADYLERSDAQRASLRSALLYPSIVMALAAISLVIMFTVVLPQFQPIFESSGERLPDLARAVFWLGDALDAFGPFLLLAGLALVLAVRLGLGDPRFRRQVDAWILRLPVVGELAAKVETARFARALGTLLTNGVVLASALELGREIVVNREFHRALADMINQLKEGRGFAEPLRQTGVFPPLAVHLARIGEESGRLDDMLLRLADILDRQVQQRIERLLTILVPAMTVALGIFVAAIIGAILSAILSTYELAT